MIIVFDLTDKNHVLNYFLSCVLMVISENFVLYNLIKIRYENDSFSN